MRLFLAICASLALAACAQPMAVESANAGSVFTNPAAYDGQTVRVEAVFQGYSAGDCQFAQGARTTSVTRSDWLVRQGEHCLYVTGGRPPSIDPSAVGKRIDLGARVIEHEGAFLLRMTEARELE